MSADFLPRRYKAAISEGIHHPGPTVFLESIGLANRESGLAADASMTFSIASGTKGLTCAARFHRPCLGGARPPPRYIWYELSYFPELDDRPQIVPDWDYSHNMAGGGLIANVQDFSHLRSRDARARRARNQVTGPALVKTSIGRCRVLHEFRLVPEV